MELGLRGKEKVSPEERGIDRISAAAVTVFYRDPQTPDF